MTFAALAEEGPATAVPANELGPALALVVDRGAAGAGRLLRTSALHCSRKDSRSGLASEDGPDMLGLLDV